MLLRVRGRERHFKTIWSQHAAQLLRALAAAQELHSWVVKGGQIQGPRPKNSLDPTTEQVIVYSLTLQDVGTAWLQPG